MSLEHWYHKTVLLVEDDAILRGILAQALMDEGLHVLTAESGEQALAIASSLEVQMALVVTDVLLPEMNGLELAAHLASLKTPPPVLFISGVLDGRDAPGPVLAKPFGPGAFLNQIARMLPPVGTATSDEVEGASLVSLTKWSAHSGIGEPED